MIAAVVSLATLGTSIINLRRTTKVSAAVTTVDEKVDKVEGVVNSKNTILMDQVAALSKEVSRLNSDRATKTPPAGPMTDTPNVGIQAGHVSVSKVEPEGG